MYSMEAMQSDMEGERVLDQYRSIMERGNDEENTARDVSKIS